MKINGVNKPRLADELILYTEGRTGTNMWGSEVALDSNFNVIGEPVWGQGNMEVPKGGYVLSGHGKASSFVLENLKKGKKVKLEIAV